MKNKILLSTLLGGALLAACTADDALNVKEVAGGVNPAAPVFNVSFDSEGDNDVTRAVMGEGNNGISWQHGDLMSLYHGGGQLVNGVLSKSGDGTDNLFFDGIMAYTRNAIYVSAEGTGGNKSTFTTQAMVLPGAAVMVYPADVDLLLRTSPTPIISVPMEQKGGEAGERTRDMAPHVSEVLHITDDEGHLNDKKADGSWKNPHSAGYGREYDIVMRRISAQLSLSLTPEGDDEITEMVNAGDINGIEFSKVSIDVDAEDGAEPFTAKATVQIGRKRGVYQEDLKMTIGDNERIGNTNNYVHGYWEFSPYIEPADVDGAKVTHIETTDLGTDKKTAYFTLLPYDDRNDVVFDTDPAQMHKIEKDGKIVNEFAGGKYAAPKFDNTEITVNTNYGYVICKDETAEKWSRSNGLTYNLTNGLAEFLYSAFYPQDEKRTEDAKKAGTNISFNKTYQNQVIARGGSRTLKVNMKDLVMNGLHVKNQKNLLDALKVYDKLVKQNTDNNKVTLILDGAEDGPYKGKFVLDKTGWDKVSEYRNSDVKFALCASTKNPAEACSAIVLDNGTAAAAEVPELAFAVTKENDIIDPVQADVTVELVGNWKYEEGEYFKTNGDKDRNKQLTGVGTLKVVKDAVLDLKNNVLAQDKNTPAKDLWIQIETGGTMNVKYYNTRVGVNVKNNGIVNIKNSTNDAELWMNNEKQFVNEIGTNVVGADLHVLKTAEELKAVGTGIVYNEGWFGNENNSKAEINNYGAIFLSSKARLYITANEEIGEGKGKIAWQSSFKTEKGKIGSIVLYDKTAGKSNVVVSDAAKVGFIKLHLYGSGDKKNVETEGKATADDYGTVANYIILDGGIQSCEKVPASEVAKQKYTYVEVSESNGEEVVMESATLTGLIVNPKCSVNIDENSKVIVEYRTYLKGRVSLGGTLKWSETAANGVLNYACYYGVPTDNDASNIMTHNSGK